MPELPEVETVRRGLASRVAGRHVVTAEVLHPRAVRRHVAGANDFVSRLRGRGLGPAARRGKYLWIPLTSTEGGPTPPDDEVLVAHLGMSGQFRIQPTTYRLATDLHVRIRIVLDDGNELDFVDQRTFGGLAIESVDDHGVPASVQHLALDPFDPNYDLAVTVARMRGRHTEVKRALLDQTVVSGIGNIYADESLWRARMHPARTTDRLTRAQAGTVLTLAAAVMRDSLAAGGTSFDDLYVDVNGESGYYERSLDVYGREGEPCARCGTPVRRLAFMNRSSFFCPRCQRVPRRRPSIN